MKNLASIFGMKSKFRILAFLFLTLGLHFLGAQEKLASYAEVYEEEFFQAVDFSVQIRKILAEKNLSEYDPDFVSAIVFPELMRYSQFSDAIEKNIDRLLHLFSNEINSCSIGPMQMKPVFAVALERDLHADPELAAKFPMIDFNGEGESVSQRMKRIERLRKLDTQIYYLLAFIEICVKRYGLEDSPVDYKIRIVSTAYNSGAGLGIKTLEEKSRRCSFPQGSRSALSKWIYWELGFDYYTLAKTSRLIKPRFLIAD